MAGAITKAALTLGYAEIVLRVSELRSAGGLGEKRFRVRARELKLFCGAQIPSSGCASQNRKKRSKSTRAPASTRLVKPPAEQTSGR